MKLCPCGKKSIPGLIKTIGLCQEHYNNLMFDTGEKHKTGVLMYNYSKQGIKLYSEIKLQKESK